jgi:hypothetical protein
MAGAFLFADVRDRSRSRAHVNWNFHLVLDLLAPALLLGLWRAWTSAMAPRMDVYFSAEALLIAYAYFAVVRAVFLNVHSHDRSGRYDRTLALKAAREFRLGVRRYRPKIAIIVLLLLVAALFLDMLTARSGTQHRPNVHLTILCIEVMIWARYGAAVVLTAARWWPPEAPAFVQARELAEQTVAARSFGLVSIAYGMAALAAVAGYKWLGPFLPSTMAQLSSSTILFTGVALLALWLQCRWAQYILPRLEDRPALDAPAPMMLRAA